MKIEMIERDEVLKAVQDYGPVLPLDIRSKLGKGDTITIGAQLSTLTSAGLLKATNVKKGGSPFYYAPGQETKLEAVHQYLNEKDRRTYEQLRNEKVMRESAQEPLTRVSLHNIPDYSKRLVVSIQGQEETYWRYFLVSEEDALGIIKQRYLSQKKEEKRPEPFETPRQEEKQQDMPQEEQKPRKKKEKQEKLTKAGIEPPIARQELPADDFIDSIKKYFETREITILETELIRKNNEYDLIVEMQTPVGKTHYYCKAKNKKKCSEGDLSQAYLKAQMKRLPALFLTTGEVTKKASEKTKTDYKGMIIARIA